MLRLRLRRPVREADFRRLGLRVDDRLALGVHQHRLGLDAHVAAPQGLASELNELLGVLRGIEHGRELAGRTPPP